MTVMIVPDSAYGVLSRIIDMKQGLRDAVNAHDAGTLNNLADTVKEPFASGDLNSDGIIGPALDTVFTARATVVLDMLNRIEGVIDGTIKIVQAYQRADDDASSSIASVETQVDQSSQTGWAPPKLTPYY